MKNLTISKIDSILVDHGMDIVGVELEFASTLSHSNFSRNILDESHEYHRSTSNNKHLRSILVDDDNLPKEAILGYSSPHYDSSIGITNSFPYPLELTSTPLPLSVVPSYIKDIWHKTRHFCTVTATCGTHYHFNSNSLDWTDIQKLAIGIVPFEPFFYMLSRPDRTLVKYCKPMGFLYTINDFLHAKDKKDLNYLFVGTKLENSNDAAKRIGKYGCNIYKNHEGLTNPRYMGLNLYSHFFRGTVEFRYFQNRSWQENLLFFNLVKRTIARIFSMSNIELKTLAEKCLGLSREDYLEEILNILSYDLDSEERYMLSSIYNDSLELKRQFRSSKLYINDFLERWVAREYNMIKYINPEAGKINKRIANLLVSASIFMPSFAEWFAQVVARTSGFSFNGFSCVPLNSSYIPLGNISSIKKLHEMSFSVKHKRNTPGQPWLSSREVNLLLAD